MVSAIQTSFNSGEWAPALNARVDLAKYHSAAALLQNYFVDYRGGASSRAGTRYILQAFKSASAVRLIGFQASFTVSYILEFGDFYIRFYNNGSPVLESTIAITAATLTNPCILSVANTYNVGDWVYVANVVGMTQLNGRYFQISARSAGTITLANLNGTAIDSSAYTAYISGGTVARVYTLSSPYAASELRLLKYAQNVSTLSICHPNHQPYILTLISATNWTLLPIVFGSSVGIPTGQAVTSTLPVSTYNYAYVVTAEDINGQESAPSAYAAIANIADLRNTGGSNSITWNAVTGATSYNVYKAEIRVTNPVPVGAAFGFIGNCTGTTFVDSNIGADYSTAPPVVQNPFQGAGVASATVTGSGAPLASIPSAALDAAPSGGSTATVNVIGGAATIGAISNSGNNYQVGATVVFTGGITLIVATIGGGGGINSFQPLSYPGSSPGAISSGGLPTNPSQALSSSSPGTLASVNFTYGVVGLQIVSAGAGYLTAPAVTFSSGGATATTTLGPAANGNPTVPSFFQQRSVFAGSVGNPQQFNMSQPGSYNNFNITNPVQPDDAIQGTLVSGQLNTIKSLISMPSGLVMLSDRQAWLVNGGSAGSAITATQPVANAQAYNGASDVPPIIANYDILYVQAKGSIVRDLSYNFYTNVYTGTDISVLSSHLFYGYTISEWAYCEEPFKLVWSVRNDGKLLALTYLKEQELIGWTHSDTQGLFKSVASVTETVSFGAVDALYTVAQRTVNGFTVQYIERMAERIFPNGATDAWCVDAGLQYNGAPATTFSGAEHLAGLTVTGLADGIVITPFVMPASGVFVLTVAASKVTVGLPYTPNLQTLELDLGEPTVQGEEKKIPEVTLKVADTLGLWIGSDSSNLVAMKDLVRGNVGSATNTVVTDLVTADVRTILDPKYSVPGQYYIRQPYPLPASVLGVIPKVIVASREKR